ncbi:hypothetical protein OPT61_g6405 [Boeremia exigua]|uniref:Uncharacterized protein n=1 Tax=Boeremia exigua TaxID=749465 RepID=A0ACC2I6S5_9PLEO|nr:hypothetical protein OPT61_g6405 [Boeremia exigua]
MHKPSKGVHETPSVVAEDVYASILMAGRSEAPVVAQADAEPKAALGLVLAYAWEGLRLVQAPYVDLAVDAAARQILAVCAQCNGPYVSWLVLVYDLAVFDPEPILALAPHFDFALEASTRGAARGGLFGGDEVMDAQRVGIVEGLHEREIGLRRVVDVYGRRARCRQKLGGGIVSTAAVSMHALTTQLRPCSYHDAWLGALKLRGAGKALSKHAWEFVAVRKKVQHRQRLGDVRAAAGAAMTLSRPRAPRSANSANAANTGSLARARRQSHAGAANSIHKLVSGVLMSVRSLAVLARSLQQSHRIGSCKGLTSHTAPKCPLLPCAYATSAMAPTTSNRPIVISGPSGAGKSTILKRLFEDYPDRFGFSVSHTTRGPRGAEKDGVEYHFVTREQFDDLIANKGFVEHATFGSNSYGTSIAAIEDIEKKGRTCILDIEMEGVKQVANHPTFPRPRFLFLSPPSMDILEQRLRGRATDKEADILKRLNQAKVEMEFAKSPEAPHDKIVVNDDLEKAYQEARAFIVGEDA